MPFVMVERFKGWDTGGRTGEGRGGERTSGPSGECPVRFRSIVARRGAVGSVPTRSIGTGGGPDADCRCGVISFDGRGRRGIDPFRLQQFVARHGIVDSRIHFTSVYQFALLRDSGIPVPIERVPDWVFRLSGRLSLSFSLTGTKA